MPQTRSPRLAFSRLAVALLLLVLPARPALAASGDLDSTFGVAGIVITDITGGSSETAYAVIVQPDGMIVAGGSVTSGAKTDFALLRYNTDGTADASFGVNGIVTTTISAGADTLRAMVLQPNGALVAIGSSGSRVAVARYLSPTGALDPGFGAGGFVTTTIGASAAPQAVALDSLGRIVVAGTANSHFFVARYTSSGALDTTFNGTGVATASIGASDWGQGVAVQPDNKVVVAGYSDLGPSENYALLRFNISGTLDTTFNVTGKVNTDIGTNTNDQAHAVAIQPDGKIVVAGFTTSGGQAFGTLRYNANGSLDTSFGVSGKVTTTVGAVNEAHALAIQPTGKIVVAGDTGSGGNVNFALVRYNKNGVLDTTFNSGGATPGIVTTDLAGGSDDLLYSLAIQSDNQIVVAGSIDQGTASAVDVAIARYDSPVAPPSVTDFGKTLLEDHTLALSATDFTSHFSDPDNNSLAAVKITVLPANGTLKLAGATVAADQVIAAASLISLTFTPDPDWNGNTSLAWNGSNGLVYAALNAALNLTVTAVNDAPTFVKALNQTVLENAGPQTVAAWATSISSGPADEAGQALTFTLSTNNPGLFSALPALDALSGDLTFTPAPNVFGTAIVTATLADDGGVANGGVNTSGPQVFTLTVLFVNQAPSFAIGPDQSVLENGGPQTVTTWASAISAGPANESGQVLTFTTATDNDALFAALPVIDSTNGRLTFTPAPNVFGSATVTVTLKDSGGTANGGVNTSITQTFGITVTFVNQAPSFVNGSSQTVLENAGPQTVTAWATSISAGPANEAGQALTFTLSTNNPGLFAAPPALDALSGDLTFTPAPNVFGSATVTATLADNGGVANGGVNTSGPQVFTLTVLFVNQAPSFAIGPDQTILENGGPQTVTTWATAISAGPVNEAGQVLTFTTATDNDALFAALPVIDSTNGRLTFTPAPNVFGSATVTVTLKDSGGIANGGADTSITQTFRVTITFVNQAPSFIAGGDQTVQAGSGPQTVTAWAGSISPGPSSEAGQALTFTVQTSNDGLFAALPAINAVSGDLTYAPGLHSWGSATITVTLMDSGGTANGGVNASALTVFQIVVQPYRAFVPIARR